MQNTKWLMYFLLANCISTSFYGQNKPDRNNPQEAVFNTRVPAHRYDAILCRPTDRSVTLSLLSSEDATITLAYRKMGQRATASTDIALKKDTPYELVVDDLKFSTSYQYQIKYRSADNPQTDISDWHCFHTQRAKGQSFRFTVMADSHLDQNTDTAAYLASLHNALADTADFHIDLGDTFMTDKYRQNYKDALSQYLAQRYYLSRLCGASPLFFVQGNHDGEAGQRLNGTADNMTVWSNLTRKRYFPNPIPDGFYSGNTTNDPWMGHPQNYYAWQWGDALLLVLDPFMYTPRLGNDNPWERTLGKEQYDWLVATLSQSTAKFKLVFIHNLVGGVDLKGRARGGAEVVPFYEWGGKNADGSDGFAEHRSSWEMPLHDLLKKYNVTAVFHGHDHLYAHQTVDGISYQCVPQPGAREQGNVRQAQEYGYLNGTVLNGPGYLRVTVQGNQLVVDYVGTDLSNPQANHRIIDSYTLKAK